jgi:hypothetical protein
LPVASRAVSTTRKQPRLITDALTRDPGNEVLTEFAFLMEATEN